MLSLSGGRTVLKNVTLVKCISFFKNDKKSNFRENYGHFIDLYAASNFYHKLLFYK